MRSYVDNCPFECSVFGSEYDGAFAQFVKIHAKEACPVKSDLTEVAGFQTCVRRRVFCLLFGRKPQFDYQNISEN